MKRTLSLVMILASMYAFGQQTPADQVRSIVTEGKLLYNSEMASWYGNDLFYAKYKNTENIGGYFSYGDGGFTKCIFYSNADRARVIGTVRFDTSYNPKTPNLDLIERDFTPAEKELYLLRENALDEMDADTLFFKSYPNTDLDLVPLVNGNERKVYVLTEPQQDSVVLLGNDYLLSFDNSNKMLGKKKLHQDLVTIYYDEKGVKQVEGTTHTHLPESGDLITATDICTLMLYEKFAKWKMYQVISKSYLSVWNCETNQLSIISRDTEEKSTKNIAVNTPVKMDRYPVRKSKKRGQPE